MKKNYEELYLKTPDGIKIAINHYNRKREKVLVIANGWTMSKDSKFIERMAGKFAESLDVISFDFRGHGSSSGLYTFTNKEPEDLKSVVDYAKKFYKETYLIGFSLGGAISIIYSSLEESPDRLIIVSAPHSFGRIKSFMWLIDFLINPFKKYEFKRWSKVRINPVIQKKIKPIDVVDKIIAPTLFIAGDSDTIISCDDTKSLFDKAKCKKKFELFKNCNHAEDLLHQNKEKFIGTCVDWLIADKNVLAKI